MLEQFGITDKDAAIIGTFVGTLIVAVLFGRRGYKAMAKTGPPQDGPPFMECSPELRKAVYEVRESVGRLENTSKRIEDDLEHIKRMVNNIHQDTQVLRDRR